MAGSFHIEFTLSAQAEFLQVLEKFGVFFFFFSSVHLCIKVTWSVIHWTLHSWSAFCIYGDLHVSLALGSVYQVNHQNGVSENKMFWSIRKHQTDFLGLNQNEEEQIWKIFPLPFWFPPEEIRQNSLYVDDIILARESPTVIWFFL